MTKNSVPEKDSSVAALSVYRRMMRLFPSAFRAEYGEEMLATFSARYNHATQRGRTGVRFWARECVALMRSGFDNH